MFHVKHYRVLPLLLALALILSLSPSLAAEPDTGFSDVSDGDWFAPYVDVCVEEGLMNGVGQGRFDPQGVVSMAEAATIAARIHHLKNGGDGNLPAAPEEWGRLILTFEDGETYTCYSGYDDGWQIGGRWGGLLYFHRPEGWDGRDYQRLTLTGWISDLPIQGQAEVVNNVGSTLRFVPDVGGSEGFYALLSAPETPPSEWFRDTDYYIFTQGLPFFCAQHSAQRHELVEALDTVVGDELTAINHITDYPDATEYQREMALRFYNAGVLTGTDAVGSFSPNGYLTRAEMAAMAARILRPELRLEFSPAQPVYQTYTLTPIPLDQELSGLDVRFLSTDLLQFDRRDEEERVLSQALLYADGTVLELPEGSYISEYPAYYDGHPYPLLALCRGDMTVPTGYAYGVLDPLTGEMALPFGPYAGHGAYPGAGNCTIVGDGRSILTKEAVGENNTWTPTLLRNDKGNVVKELPESDSLSALDWYALERDGLIPVYDKASQLWGYKDASGGWAIQPQYGWANGFDGGRAIVTSTQGDGIIDSQGREIIPCVYSPLTRRGQGLYRANEYGGNSYWLREDGSTLCNGYLNYDIYLYNGYFALGNKYLDEDFQYATPAIFDWTGPINSQGSGFVGMDGKVYRIQFEK